MGDLFKKYKNNGNDIDAAIEPKATYFVKASVIIKTISAKNVAMGISPKKTPNPVATPFPPLKRKNGVQM